MRGSEPVYPRDRFRAGAFTEQISLLFAGLAGARKLLPVATQERSAALIGQASAGILIRRRPEHGIVQHPQYGDLVTFESVVHASTL
jgi:hypothetical protein